MMQQGNGRPLPKFGEWDTNNAAAAEGYTVIFNKARVEKTAIPNKADAQKPNHKNDGRLKTESSNQYRSKSRRWFCCG